MRTIGRHWPKRRLDGDFQAMCGYCGVHWRFFRMRRDRSGRLACPDDMKGRDEITLSEANARAAREAAKRRRRPRPYAGYDNTGTPSTGAQHLTTSEDIEL